MTRTVYGPGGGGATNPHAATHEPGGTDPMAANAAAGTASLRSLGTTATAAAAGNHSHTGLTADQAAGTASVRTLGGGAQQAAAGNHSHAGLLADSATAVNNTAATDIAGLVADFNGLLAALRTRGIITGS
ncbi:hypothetical protein [Micromonospora arborensis]|uniref:hypothetical protein n=1 Tax=Micromonospora arborensis TaxID=2116518 RepID=UPI0037137017